MALPVEQALESEVEEQRIVLAQDIEIADRSFRQQAVSRHCRA